MPNSTIGYKYLRTYQLSTVIYDFTVEFCNLFIDKRSRTHDQMVQAARSGKQNIAEGYCEKSLKMYIKLLGVAMASLVELKEDYEDFLRQRKLILWDKDSKEVREFRAFRVIGDPPRLPQCPQLPGDSQTTANLLVTLCQQTTFLLNRQITSLEEKFIREGGYSENLFQKRLNQRRVNF